MSATLPATTYFDPVLSKSALNMFIWPDLVRALVHIRFMQYKCLQTPELVKWAIFQILIRSSGAESGGQGHSLSFYFFVVGGQIKTVTYNHVQKAPFNATKCPFLQSFVLCKMYSGDCNLILLFTPTIRFGLKLVIKFPYPI